MQLDLQPGLNVLLGATLAGKTTLLRLLAGLEKPTTGRVLVEGRDVTGVPVQQRNLAMVYQQFINYPSLTVFENIASPLRLARQSAETIRKRVGAIAEALKLTPFLDRRPGELSGGQQQRTALARALAKDAHLILLDEPLVNLDYKLREDLRHELRSLFADSKTTVVYATTEPQEALQLGGRAAVLVQGRLVEYGATHELFRKPQSLSTARAFSDPPLNEIPAHINMSAGVAELSDGLQLPLPISAMNALQGVTEAVLGVRAHQISLTPSASSTPISGRIELAEISGSETYVHLAREKRTLTAQVPGVHEFSIGEQCVLHVDPKNLFGFSTAGRLLFAPP